MEGWLCYVSMCFSDDTNDTWYVLSQDDIETYWNSKYSRVQQVLLQQFVSKRVFFRPPKKSTISWMSGMVHRWSYGSTVWSSCPSFFKKPLIHSSSMSPRHMDEDDEGFPKGQQICYKKVRLANSVQLSDFNATIWSNYISEFRWSFEREWWFV